MVFCFFGFLVSIRSAVATGLELLGAARVGRFLSPALLRAHQVLADVEKVSHNRPFVLVTVPEIIKEQPEITRVLPVSAAGIFVLS
jgi:hypothetical protein